MARLLRGSATVTGANDVGMIAPFAMASPPVGWLVCDGTAYNSTTLPQYAALFAAIANTWGGSDGTDFQVPDLEGAFLRGTGSHATSNMANGSDFAGPSIGAFENDQSQGHIHNFRMNSGAGRAGNAESSVNTYIAGEASTTAYTWRTDSNANNTAVIKAEIEDASSNGTPRTGDETRPFNAGVKYCIKYY